MKINTRQLDTLLHVQQFPIHINSAPFDPGTLNDVDVLLKLGLIGKNSGGSTVILKKGIAHVKQLESVDQLQCAYGGAANGKESGPSCRIGPQSAAMSGQLPGSISIRRKL